MTLSLLQIDELPASEVLDVASLLWEDYQARPAQKSPEGADWNIWLVMCGRGWGKTRVGAEQVRQWARGGTGVRIHIVGRTATDVRDTMILGESGLVACCEFDRGNQPAYKPSQKAVLWPNGAQAHLFSAEEPASLRGPQCTHWWADELPWWQYPETTWDNLQMGARLGRHPQGVVTCTPRPIKLIKDLVRRSDVRLSKGSTFDNSANLAETFLQMMMDRYDGTRKGQQELHGKVLMDNPMALWKRSWIDDQRVTQMPPLVKAVIGVDPGIKDREPGSDPDTQDSAAEAGIVGVGVGADHRLYVFNDSSLQGTPNEWAQAAVTQYNNFHCDHVVAEANQGGAMVKSTLRTVSPNLPVRLVFASRGKELRAEPVSSLYEQGKVSHVGSFPLLEDQMCEWVPGEKSPDRLDALVWAATDLLSQVRGEAFASNPIAGLGVF